MNYYPHHIGDYAKDTGHLTMLEDAAYRRMLDVVYATEKPLPQQQEKIYRLVRARSNAEKLAVDVVLGEFWIEGDGGWHNVRADAEIAKAREDGEDSAARRENERERQKRHRERRKALFAQLRGHGEVPKFDTSADELETLLKRVQVRDGHAPVTRTATANQEPITNNQITTPLPPSGAFVRFWEIWPKNSRKASRGKCFEVWKKGGFDSVVDQIITHVETMKLSLDWRKESGAYVPAPLVYLKAQRWDGAELSAGHEKRMVV